MKDAHRNPLALIDVIKAVASQLIVWHHLLLYGPMANRFLENLGPAMTSVTRWILNDARLAVQAFLVVGGYLAARSLLKSHAALRTPLDWRDGARLVGNRYTRLAQPYVVALGFAIVAAVLARLLIDDADTPPLPTLSQVAAHVLLVHDIVGTQALSAGVWYIAIDFQLYALLVIAIWLAQRLGAAAGISAAAVLRSIGGLLWLFSLFWFNLDQHLDIWAPYFFGAYGLGILIYTLENHRDRSTWLAVLWLFVLSALLVEWRTRIAVACLSGVLLAYGLNTVRVRLPQMLEHATNHLSRISYSVFLMHYPTSLALSALAAVLFPETAAWSLAALLLIWGTSLWCGTLLHRHVEMAERPFANARQLISRNTLQRIFF